MLWHQRGTLKQHLRRSESTDTMKHVPDQGFGQAKRQNASTRAVVFAGLFRHSQETTFGLEGEQSLIIILKSCVEQERVCVYTDVLVYLIVYSLGCVISTRWMYSRRYLGLSSTRRTVEARSDILLCPRIPFLHSYRTGLSFYLLVSRHPDYRHILLISS